MEIRESIKKNFFKVYNFYNGVYVWRKKIKKNPSRRIPTYTEFLSKGFICCVILIFFLAIISVIFSFDKETIYGISKLITIVFCFYLFLTVAFIISYLYTKHKLSNCVVTIDETGVTDEDERGITIKYSWKQIDFLVIKDDCICVFPKNMSIVIFAKGFEEEKLINEIKKYDEEILVILA